MATSSLAGPQQTRRNRRFGARRRHPTGRTTTAGRGPAERPNSSLLHSSRGPLWVQAWYVTLC